MNPAPMLLDPLAVRAPRLDLPTSLVQREAEKLNRVGFYRRTVSVGYLLGPDEVRDLRPFVTTDLLRQIPRVSLQPIQGGSYVPVLGGAAVQKAPAPGRFGEASPTTGVAEVQGCVMKVVVDGMTLPLDSGLALDHLVPAQDVLAIEVYPRKGGVGAPVEYRGIDAYCGVILIWTRER
jgi:hypothetical protein